MDYEHGVAFLLAQITGTKHSASAGDPGKGTGASLTDAIAEAKRRLAESLGIASEKIEITIRL